jgi:cobalt-zinc-cadmium efflux system protein
MAHDHNHAHGLEPGRLDRAMLIGVGLNLGFVGVEVAFGLLADSLALIADAGHNASDVIGLLLAWAADWLARRPPSRRYTWGLGRVTIYAAFANAVLLLAACGAIVWEAWHRLADPPQVAGLTVIGVAALGVVINTATALLFIRGHGDANVRGAFLHMAADAAVSAGVVLAGITIAMTGLGWVDPAVSILIALVIVVGTWGLFRESVDLALDAVPRGVDSESLRAALETLPGVVAMHDLRLWGASTSQASLTVHLVVTADADRDQVLASAMQLVQHEFHVAHVTIQIEGESSSGCGGNGLRYNGVFSRPDSRPDPLE